MTGPIKQLKEEHEAIVLMLRILGKACNGIESGEYPGRENLVKIIEFIRGFADKCHHGKEEGILFASLEGTDIYREGRVEELLEEHRKARAFAKNMGDAVANPGKHNLSAFFENARKYIALLGRHIGNENGKLFPIADAYFSEQKKKEILEGFEKIEQERIGVGKHAEFHKILKELKNIYLK